MTWPKKNGGHERSFLERYVVTEEIPRRQRAGAAALRRRPPERADLDEVCAGAREDGRAAAHLRGDVCFAIGMSEPVSARICSPAKTKATKTNGGWLINGTKIWTSNAHIADYMIALFRPSRRRRRTAATA
jgi:alkylation response protein AidB-like acyl-CoA dehydrogenase